MILIEWTKYTFQTNYGPYLHAFKFPNTHTILVNGKGSWPEADALKLNVPLQVFTVKKGHRYRFRLINAGVDYCFYAISIENHNLTVIASDGVPFDLVVVESIVSKSGERYDFIINANGEERDYWIKIVGEGNCFNTNASQRAILRYERSNVDQNQYDSTIPMTYKQLMSTGLVTY